MPIAVASNSSRKFVERTLGGAGLLDDHFATVVTADDVDQPQAGARPLPRRLRSPRGRPGALRRARGLGRPASPPPSAAGLFVIAVPYFPEITFGEASLTAPSLADPAVAAALGLNGI